MKISYISYISFTIAAIFFTLASSIVKYAANYSGLEISFWRFLIGVVSYTLIKFIFNKKISTKGLKYIIGRGVFNSLAVFCFYTAVIMTTVAEGNVLNMTYPIFIALLAPLMIGEKTTFRQVLLILVGFVGIYITVNPQFVAINVGHLYGLASAIFAAIALVWLRLVRKTGSDVFSVLFWVNLSGLIVLLILLKGAWPVFYPVDFMFAAMSALAAIGGQIAITYGYRFTKATTGGLLITSRIPLAILAGFLMFGEKIKINVLLGSAIILLTIIVLALNNKSANKRN